MNKCRHNDIHPNNQALRCFYNLQSKGHFLEGATLSSIYNKSFVSSQSVCFAHNFAILLILDTLKNLSSCIKKKKNNDDSRYITNNDFNNKK